jgi:RHS repeat-associated protein
MYQSYKSRIFRNCSQYYFLSKTGKWNSLDHTAQLWLNHSSDKVLGTIHPDSCLKQLSYQAIYNPLSRQYMDYNEMSITYNYDTNTYDTLSLLYERGEKFFELCNHLGNVMVSISDRKLPKDTLGDNTVDHFRADVLSAGDYYAFGMPMPGRNYCLYEYRFGFQNQEKDNEIFGSTGSFINFKYRGYDSRLGRFWSVDPLTRDYPYNSPFAFSENRVIDGIELEGLERVSIQKEFTHSDGEISTEMRGTINYNNFDEFMYMHAYELQENQIAEIKKNPQLFDVSITYKTKEHYNEKEGFQYNYSISVEINVNPERMKQHYQNVDRSLKASMQRLFSGSMPQDENEFQQHSQSSYPQWGLGLGSGITSLNSLISSGSLINLSDHVQDFSNTYDVMKWIQNNPNKIKEIQAIWFSIITNSKK